MGLDQIRKNWVQIISELGDLTWVYSEMGGKKRTYFNEEKVEKVAKQKTWGLFFSFPWAGRYNDEKGVVEEIYIYQSVTENYNVVGYV